MNKTNFYKIGGQMILFLFLACEKPDCLELQEPQPAEQWNVEQMHVGEEDLDSGEPLDTAYDTGGE